MKTFEENAARIAKSMGRAAGQSAPSSPFFLGEVREAGNGKLREAGNGKLRVNCGGIDLTAGDLYVSAGLDYKWTQDNGLPELLRRGDRVVLLSGDGQAYYLITRVVRV